MAENRKNILFLVHSNNDMDYFLPVIHGMNGKGDMAPVVFFLVSEEESHISAAHKYLLEELNVPVYSLKGSVKKGFFGRWLTVVSTRSLKLSGTVPIKMLCGSGDVMRSFWKMLYIVVERLFSVFPQMFFRKEHIAELIEGVSPSLVVVDVQRIEKHAPFSDLRSYCNSTIVAFCKRKKIPVFMMEHGAISIVDFGDLNKCVFFRFDNETCDFEERYYRPDIMALSFDHERKGYSRLIGPGTVVKALGTVRYDRAWNEYIQGISVRIDKSGIRKNKFTVLYVVAPLSKEANEVMTPEILAIAEKFPETELWVKLHPRYQWAISDDISKGSDRIRLFRNDVDINVLLHYADLVISPLSSVLFQAIIDGIPVILYERWKKLMNFTGRTAFEDTECIFRASEPEMLYNHCSRVIAGERPSMRDFREFYKKKISSGIDMDKSMVEGYLKAIREACR